MEEGIPSTPPSFWSPVRSVVAASSVVATYIFLSSMFLFARGGGRDRRSGKFCGEAHFSVIRSGTAPYCGRALRVGGNSASVFISFQCANSVSSQTHELKVWNTNSDSRPPMETSKNENVAIGGAIFCAWRELCNFGELHYSGSQLPVTRNLFFS